MTIAELVELPPQCQRRVVGVWLMPDMPAACTRSIEEVHGRYYLVSRMLDGRGEFSAVNGSRGLPLERVASGKFRSAAGAVYSIEDSGRLVACNRDSVIFEAEPYPQLWPETGSIR